MTSTLAPAVGAILDTAATAAADLLTLGEPVTLGPVPGADTAAEPVLAGAVVVAFTGQVSGEIAILFDAQLQDMLAAAAPGADLGVALGPAVEAVATVVGPVTLGAPQLLDARPARQRVALLADAGEVALCGASGVRAVVAIGIDRAAQGTAAQPATFGGEPLARLDLLRGVEMQASVELGRARMTIHELLSLRSGAVVELDRAAGDPADLYVNGRLMARGEVVVVEENYALRITAIVSDEATR